MVRRMEQALNIAKTPLYAEYKDKIAQCFNLLENMIRMELFINVFLLTSPAFLTFFLKFLKLQLFI